MLKLKHQNEITFGSSKPFSKIELDGDSVYLSKLRDQKNASSIPYMETMPSLVSPRGVRVKD